MILATFDGQLSKGFSVEIDLEMSKPLRILSILLDNEELYSIINDYLMSEKEDNNEYDSEFISETIDTLSAIQFEEKTTNFYILKYYEYFLSIIASHFFRIEKEKLLKLPKIIVYSILSNPQLKVANEDMLVDFIDELFSRENNCEEKSTTTSKLNKVDFYELIEFTSLSENKFKEFLHKFDISELATPLWSRLVECFFTNLDIVKEVKSIEERQLIHETRYSSQTKETKIKYEGDKLNGIIRSLGEGDAMRVINEGIIDIKSSSAINSINWDTKNVFDFNDSKKGFHSRNEPNSWICYDFKENKVKLSHYSLQSHGHGGRSNNHLFTWCIEGSDDMNDWEMLDTRNAEESVARSNCTNTFQINKSKQNKYYRYIRLRQTGVNTCNNNSLVFSALEFFGKILKSNEHSK